MVESNLKNGCLIISTASILNDENFNRSVIFLAEHNLNGSLGFILNRNLNFKLKDLIPDTSSNFKVYYDFGPDHINSYSRYL